MKKKYYKMVNYKELFLSLIREKYVSLILGMIVAFLISSLTYKVLAKNIHFKSKLKLPNFHIAMPKLPKLSLFHKTAKVVKPEKKVVKFKTYEVVEGDDLWHVAEKFYGSGFNAYDVALFNKLDTASGITPGQKLLIPEVTPRAPTVGDIGDGAATSLVTYTEGQYVVQPGDSLSIIAQKVYGDLFAWPRLLEANKLGSPDKIEVGMILVIPR